jgi:hypothetical protein
MDGPNTEVTSDGFKLETLRGAHDFVSVMVWYDVNIEVLLLGSICWYDRVFSIRNGRKNNASNTLFYWLKS